MKMNKAIRKLMDLPEMIGRHRVLIGKWFEDNVVNVESSQTIPADEAKPETLDLAKQKIRNDLAKMIAVQVTITEETVPAVPGWKRGQPIPKDCKKNLVLTGSLQTFKADA